MASTIFILDSKGAPLITRTYRGDISQNVSQVFVKRVLDEEEFGVTPVFEHEGVTYCYIRQNNVYLLAVSKVNVNPTMLIALLRHTVAVFESYFNLVTEETIRDNFVIIYELLDEMIDFGFPQYTEAKILKEYITQEGLLQTLIEEEQLNVAALPSAVTGVGGATPWRLPGKKYRKNEVFLDVVESVNLLVGQDGETLSSEVLGVIKMRVYLTGMPELKLGLNDKVFFETSGKKAKGKVVDLEDIKFHQCVKLNRFESDRTISFIPPDGEFDLMSYRLTTVVKPLIHVSVQVVRHGESRVEMALTAKSSFKKTSVATFVDVLIPIPVDADTPTAKTNYGNVKYAPQQEALVWSMKNFAGGKDFRCTLQYTLPSVRSSDSAAFARKPIQVKFELPYFTASGFQVRYLKVTEKSNYEALPWVRYVTQNGEYQVRCS